MLKFAGVELDGLKVQALSDDQLQNICTAFIENYKASGEPLVGFGLPEKFIRHLKNFYSFEKIITMLDNMQTMAMAIRFFPDATQACESTRDDDVLQIVREVLQHESCKEASLDGLYEIINRNKKKLDFMYDWQDTAEECAAAVLKSNLAITYQTLRQIKSLTKDNPRIISLQIIYYLIINEYIKENLPLGHPNVLHFYSKIQEEINLSLGELAYRLGRERTGIFFFSKATNSNHSRKTSEELTKLRADF